MKEYKNAVYIGRFQPFHLGHLEVVRKGLEIADTVTIVVGSANATPNIKNPWSFDERKEMIHTSINEVIGERESFDLINVVGVRDYYYNENTWISEIQAKTGQFIREGDSVALLGAYKDHSSYYISHFPQWDFIAHTIKNPITGSSIREQLFWPNIHTDYTGATDTTDIKEVVEPLINELDIPNGTRKVIKEWATKPLYSLLCKEFKFIQLYKQSWKGAPFPPTLVTTDAIVVCSGHVLVVKRKMNPGKGSYALPGGFLKASERLQDGMLRELREETRIRVDKLILASSIVTSRVFDHPDRSLRGRTITHGYYIKLKDGKLPEVNGGDDASEAFWMPLMDVVTNENKFYEDHAHIIYNLTNS